MNPYPVPVRVLPLLAAVCLGAAPASAFALTVGERADGPSMTSLVDAPADDASPATPSSAPPSLGAALPVAAIRLLALEPDRGESAVAASGRNGEESVFRSVLAGTLSAALPGRRTELAMPFAAIDYGAREGHDNAYSLGHDGDYSLRRIDLQLRRFAKDDREGMYAGTLMRAAWLDGTAYAPLEGGGDGRSAETKEDRDDALSRIGAGVVVGLRGELRLKALPGRLYWGSNLHVGRWLGGSPTRLAAELQPVEETERYFVDLEVAKVGMRF